MVEKFKPADDETITQAVTVLNGYPGLYEVAESYATEHRLPPSDRARAWSLFVRGCIDFLRRGRRHPRKDQYWRDAKAMRDVLPSLKRHHEYFVSLMNCPDPVFGGFDSAVAHADRALWALEMMADDLERLSDEYGQAQQNHTLGYCIGRRFTDAEMPSPSYDHLRVINHLLGKAIGDSHPPSTAKLKKVSDADERDVMNAVTGRRKTKPK